MAKFAITPHAAFETTTPAELRQELMAHEDARQAARNEGKKLARVELQGQAVGGVLRMGGEFVTGPAAAGGATIGGQAGAPSPQPRAGYSWLARRISVSGLIYGATPDVVNLFRSQRRANAWIGQQVSQAVSGGEWQFNGNSFAATFSYGELEFHEGETPILVSQGTFVSTQIITFVMDYLEVPQPKMFEGLS